MYNTFFSFLNVFVGCISCLAINFSTSLLLLGDNSRTRCLIAVTIRTNL